MTALHAWLAIGNGVVWGVVFGWLYGHRSGVARERERSSKRVVQMMETRRTIEKAAR